MNDKIIKELNDLKLGGKYYATKDQPSDVSEIIYKLGNLGVLKKDRYIYSVNNIKHLSKVIELKSIDSYVDWVSSQSEQNNNKTEINIDKIGFINNAENKGIQSLDSDFTKAIIKNENENPTKSDSNIWTTSNIIFTLIMGLIGSFIFWYIIS